MFTWRDYEENTALFIKGISTNIAILRYKDFRVTDVITGMKFKVKSSNIDEAKIDAINMLKVYWKRVHKDVNKVMEIID